MLMVGYRLKEMNLKREKFKINWEKLMYESTPDKKGITSSHNAHCHRLKLGCEVTKTRMKTKF